MREVRDPKPEEGQSLIEMVVAMGLLAVVIALFAQAFMAGTFSSGYAQVKEVAVTLADSAIDDARAVTPPSSLLSGTCVTTSPAQVDLSETYCSDPSSQGAFEQSPKSTAIDSTMFTTTVFAGSCYLQSSGRCTLTQSDAPMIRVIAEVTWTASSACTNGTCYYVASSLISNASDPTLNTVLPGAPTGLNAAPGNAQVSLSWTDPASNGGSPITGYDVYDATSFGGENYSVEACTASGPSATSCSVSGLTNGTTYYFTVEAVNAAGNSSPSTEVSTAPYTVPGAPTSLTATAGNAQVSLSWTAPASNGGSPVTGYDIYMGTSSGAESYASAVCTATVTNCTVQNLAAGTYYFTVETVNAAGNSSYSNEAHASATPGVALSSTSGPVGTSVTIFGSGFTNGKTINSSSGVTFNGTNVSIGSTQTVASNGTWSTTFTVPNSSSGSQTVKATDSSGMSATATFTVQSAITLSITSGPVGTSVTISGTGFPNGKTINSSSGVTFNGTNVSIGSTQTVASNGTWSATFTVPNSSSGSQTVKATDSSGVSATATFTVSNG